MIQFCCQFKRGKHDKGDIFKLCMTIFIELLSVKPVGFGNVMVTQVFKIHVVFSQ